MSLPLLCSRIRATSPTSIVTLRFCLAVSRLTLAGAVEGGCLSECFWWVAEREGPAGKVTVCDEELAGSTSKRFFFFFLGIRVLGFMHPRHNHSFPARHAPCRPLLGRGRATSITRLVLEQHQLIAAARTAYIDGWTLEHVKRRLFTNPTMPHHPSIHARRAARAQDAPSSPRRRAPST